MDTNISKVEKLVNDLQIVVESIAAKADNDINDLSFDDLLDAIKRRFLNDDDEYDNMTYSLDHFVNNTNLLAYCKRKDIINNLKDYHQKDLDKYEATELDWYVEKYGKLKRTVEFYIKRTDMGKFKQRFENKLSMHSYFSSDLGYTAISHKEDAHYRTSRPNYYRIILSYFKTAKLIQFTNSLDFEIFNFE